MSEKLISKLTPEQEALIPLYREKWKKIALSTERIDKEKATEAVELLYYLICKEKPKILFDESPYQAFNQDFYEEWVEYRGYLEEYLRNQFRNQIGDSIWHKIWEELYLKTDNRLEFIWSLNLLFQLETEIGNQIELIHEYTNSFDLHFWYGYCCWFDYCISVLNCSHNPKYWQAFQGILSNCGLIFCTDTKVLICDRPTQLHLDNLNLLHAEGKPAIQFADGYSLYAYHGTTLPEEYGKHHPQQWQPSWLLQEQNAELRKILIQEIGYYRILEELQAIEINYDQEYTLLKINLKIDIEPIYLLKIICPSTGNVHVLRVPPEMKSAREAITWVNWDIPPEDFTIQT